VQVQVQVQVQGVGVGGMVKRADTGEGKRERERRRRPRSLIGRVPFDVVEDRTDETLTSYAGLPLALKAFTSLTLDRAAKRHLLLKERDQGPSDVEWATVATMVHVVGGDSPAELDQLKQESGLARAWPLLERVSQRSLRDHLARFDDPSSPRAEQGKATIVSESEGLRGLGAVRDHLVHQVQRRRRVRRATIDVDASIIESSKRAALAHYDHGRGYQPIFAYWAEQRLIVCDQFRDGNVPASFEIGPFTLAAFDALPPTVEERFFRSDSAGYDHKLLRELDRRGILFAVSADMCDPIRAECRALPSGEWRPVRNAEGRKTDREVAEVVFVPDDASKIARQGEKAFRYIVVRIPTKEKQLDLFDPAPDGYRYFAIVTNRTESPEEINRWQRERCGSVEVAIDFLKNDTGAGVMTSQKPGANAAWLRYGVIAMNLLEAIKVLFPERAALELAFARPSTIRRRLVQVGGRFIRHANRLMLVVAGGLGALFHAIHASAQAAFG
jgi:hypothetical protein